MDFSWTKRSSSPTRLHELFASNNSLQWIQVKVQPHLVSTIALNQLRDVTSPTFSACAALRHDLRASYKAIKTSTQQTFVPTGIKTIIYMAAATDFVYSVCEERA